LEEWLDALASSAPAPGGGAVAALHAATGAALIEMVCNLTIGKPKYAAVEEIMRSAREEAGGLRAAALDLGEQDAEVFTAVTQAYKIPRDDPTRSDRIQAALVDAAEIPRRTAETAQRIVDLAEKIAGGANTAVLSDVVVALYSARAAIESALVNIRINASSIKDTAVVAELTDAISGFDREIRRAELLARTVAARI
ncbi:MAG TPA: cyclodeaminase/cyclohydrolase family protein, partial [Mycobacteriales bacterium]|nr:cyclodeaminase/cyclohydrolase family protein [Mycobacteriales bacterium]